MMNQNFMFSWSNLSAWYHEKIDGRKSKKTVLNTVSGTVFSGSLVAVLGVSGAGKTTFLASLAGKNKDKEGLILLNNHILTENHLNCISNYVYQKEIILESLTVMEHMRFMCSFKLNKHTSETTSIMKSILLDLNLENCKNTVLKNLSGGERKRVSLAVEMLNDPIILFCDEPTSGLDTSNAMIIVQQLRNRACNQRLVILTIHQPSSQIFDLFTDIILLGNGEIIYQGSKEAMGAYFGSLNLHCPTNYNPADFYIKCVSMDGVKMRKRSRMCYKNKLFKRNNELDDLMVLSDFKYNNANFFKSIYWLTWRNYLDAWRNMGYHIFQFLLLMITASILAAFYSFVENGDDHAVQNIKGILYFFTSELIFTHTYNVVNTFPGEYCTFLREKSLYSTRAYFVSKILAILPRNVFQPFFFLLINFFFVRFLSGFVMFFQVFGVTICACLCASMIGLCISAFFTSLEYMDLFIAPFELITMLAAGIMINVNSSIFLKWVKYISPFYYTYESLSIIHWSKITSIDCQNGTLCYANGKEVLEELEFETRDSYVLWNVAYMLILGICIALMAFVALFWKRKRHFSY